LERTLGGMTGCRNEDDKRYEGLVVEAARPISGSPASL